MHLKELGMQTRMLVNHFGWMLVIYAALNDASYNGEGTLLFDAATDTPSAA